jgi:hypothetical protein
VGEPEAGQGGERAVPRHHAEPRSEVHRLDNLAVALRLLESQGVRLESVTARMLLEGSEVAVMGLVWTLVKVPLLGLAPSLFSSSSCCPVAFSVSLLVHMFCLSLSLFSSSHTSCSAILGLSLPLHTCGHLCFSFLFSFAHTEGGGAEAHDAAAAGAGRRRQGPAARLGPREVRAPRRQGLSRTVVSSNSLAYLMLVKVTWAMHLFSSVVLGLASLKLPFHDACLVLLL